MTQFAFLQSEWPEVAAAALRAEALAHPDPRAACFYARRALELLVHWAYKYDSSLKLPYQDNLQALLHEPTFKKAADVAVFSKTQIITRLGNQAVHSQRIIAASDSLVVLRELFHVAYWAARTYGRKGRPAPGLQFDAAKLPRSSIPRQTVDQLQKLENDLRARDEKLAVLLADKNALDEELKRLREEVAAVRRATATQADTHDYREAETRDYFIDVLLKEAGWSLAEARDREYEHGCRKSNSTVSFA